MIKMIYLLNVYLALTGGCDSSGSLGYGSEQNQLPAFGSLLSIGRRQVNK